MGQQHKISEDSHRFIPQKIDENDVELRRFSRWLIERLGRFVREVTMVVNRQSVKYFSQNAAPTTTELPDGQIAVWNDADAGGGSSTHYIVYNDAGTIVTFASEETV